MAAASRAAAWHRTPRAPRTKGCDWRQGADLLLQALSALGAVSCFCGGEKSHLQILFQSQNLFRQSYKRDNGGGGVGWGGVRYVCTSQILSHTHTPASGTQAPLSEPQAGAWPAEQGFRGHWITTNLSWLSPVHTLCPNSDRPLPDPHGCKQRGRGSPWGIVDPEGREGRSLSLPERDLTDS